MRPIEPSKLIHRLVQEAGGSLPVAKAMGAPSFQGTLHKIAAGEVLSPKRVSAERIARHFHIPIDAVYDARSAGHVWNERFGSSSSTEAPPPSPRLVARETPPESRREAWPFKTVTAEHLGQLSPNGLAELERSILTRIAELLLVPTFTARGATSRKAQGVA
jgi:hypothetical protein